MWPQNSHHDSLSIDALERIDQICEAFEKAWNDDETPLLEEFLQKVASAERSTTLRHLLSLELEYRRQRGDKYAQREYCSRFSENTDVVADVFRWLGETHSPTASQSQDPSALPSLPGHEVISEIARGGMGVIYRVQERKFHRPLAVKVMLPQAAKQAHLVERFRNEAQITGQLQHPGIPPVHDQGNLENGVPFFAMKLVEGQTLDALLKQRSDVSLDLPYYFSVFEQICQTLGYAHSQKTIHRDLKPGNIMVGAFGEVQIMDWGLAKQLNAPPSPVSASAGNLQELFSIRQAQESNTAPLDDPSTTEPFLNDDGFNTQEGQVMGTIAYMAAEQARGEVTRLDERCDVFALGAILCSILTGSPPYRSTREELWRQAREADLTDAWQRLDTCGADQEVVTLCRRCLSGRLEDRPPNASDVAQRVTEYLASVQTRLKQAEIEAATASVRAESEHKQRELVEGKAVAERKRRRATSVMTVVGLLLLGSLGIGGFAAWQQSSLEQVRYNTSFERVYQLLKNYRYKEALQTCRQLTNTLSFWVPQRLRAQLQQTQQETELLMALDRVRQNKAVFTEGKFFNRRQAAEEYDKAFATKVGFSLGAGTFVASVAKWIDSRPPVVEEQVLAALDDWAVSLAATKQTKKRSLVLAAIARIDQDPLRKQLRQQQVWADQKKWDELMERLDWKDVSPQFLHSVALKIRSRKGNQAAVEFLELVQVHHPTDFWLHFSLAHTHTYLENYDLAIGGFRAALAVRPTVAPAYNIWGIILAKKKNLEGAVAKYKTAVTLDPKYATPYNNWGLVLYRKKDLEGAIARYKMAVTLDPKYAYAYYNWGLALRGKHDLGGAIQKYTLSLKHDPTHPESNCNLGLALRDQGLFQPALKYLRRGHNLGTKGGQAWRYPSTQWVKHCEKLLRLDQQREAILSGQASVSVSDRLTLADACRRYSKCYQDAVKLYAQLLTKHPQAKDVNFQLRYHAACCATLAAAGKGNDAKSLELEEKTKLRKQALGWLQADLQAYRTLLKKSRFNAIGVLPRLQQWQKEPDLLSLRYEKAIAKLPKDEQREWTKLWSKVKDLEQTTRNSFTTRTLQGVLTAQNREQSHAQKWTAGHAYVIEMQSKQFDTYLCVEDFNGNKLKENDDIAKNNLNSRLHFTPKQDGTYLISATSYQQRGRGKYTLFVREFPPTKRLSHKS